jgi:3',5'-cyclic AMP phosphodiesterase CpdA
MWRVAVVADRPAGTLFAISDLHVSYPQNRLIVEQLGPLSDGDWLLVAGDVAETVADVGWALGKLADRFAQVIWTPGNHELWTLPRDDVRLRGEARYRHLVRLCRSLGVLTPEDPFPVWQGHNGPVTVAPLFTLYDYTFRTDPAHSREEALAAAHQAGVVCTDEYLLHSDPYPGRDEWCRQRVAYTEQRLAGCDPELPTVLVNHWPLRREPTQLVRYPHFALWCGTQATADWHIRFRAAACVYGHLHIPRRTEYDGVPFHEVSVGYPREWSRRATPASWLRPVLPGERAELTARGGPC